MQEPINVPDICLKQRVCVRKYTKKAAMFKTYCYIRDQEKWMKTWTHQKNRSFKTRPRTLFIGRCKQTNYIKGS